MAKNLILGLIQTRQVQIWAIKYFFKILTLSVTRYYGQYHHVQYQKKLMTQSWENLVTAGRTDEQRDRQRWTREILSLHIQPNYGKIRTRKTPYLDNSYAVTFTQHITKFSQISTLPYSAVFPNLRKLMTYCCKLWENCNSPERQYCYFLGVKELPWMTCIIKLTKL